MELPADAFVHAAEAMLYSDANFTGSLEIEDISPNKIINLISMREGDIGEALVLRHSLHLPPHDFNRPTPAQSETDDWLGLTLDGEFATLLSLFLGVRVWSGGLTREFKKGEDPAGRPIGWDHVRPTWQRSRRPVLPAKVNTQRFLGSIAGPIRRLPRLSAEESIVLTRAARQYQLALWVADTDPELAWLQLVSAVEVAATYWRGQESDPVESLNHIYPRMGKLLAEHRDLLEGVAAQLAKLIGSTSRFLNFMTTFDPGPPEDRCEEHFQLDWGKLKSHLRFVYNYRSSRLHGGEPFPGVMNQPPMVLETSNRPCERPFGIAHFASGGAWPSEELPMHLWVFEHLVRGALMRWFDESLGGEMSTGQTEAQGGDPA